MPTDLFVQDVTCWDAQVVLAVTLNVDWKQSLIAQLVYLLWPQILKWRLNACNRHINILQTSWATWLRLLAKWLPDVPIHKQLLTAQGTQRQQGLA